MLEDLGVLKLGFRVLELEGQEGTRKVEKSIGLDPFYKGDEYQASSSWPFES